MWRKCKWTCLRSSCLFLKLSYTHCINTNQEILEKNEKNPQICARKRKSIGIEVASTAKKITTTVTERRYFKWTNEETQMIRKDFSEYVNNLDGNRLPGKKSLLKYCSEKSKKSLCRFSWKDLKNKIMNEQYKKQRLVKTRFAGMTE